MLFERRLREGIQDGSITVAFRRWRRQQVVAGHRYRTGTDLVLVESVDIVDPQELGPEQASAAGYPSIDQLLADLHGPGDVPLYRLTFRRLDDPDPRAQLAADAALTPDDVLVLDARLDRMDARSVGGPWTRAVLTAIGAHPGEPAARLAATMGLQTQPFKQSVRRLKELGLTLSPEIGYRLSPRGEAYLAGTRTAEALKPGPGGPDSAA